MKKLLISLISCSMLLTCTLTVSAHTEEFTQKIPENVFYTYTSASEKQKFVKDKTDDYELLKQNGDSKKCTSEEADKMMADYAFANNTEKLLLEQEMEQYGIYIFSNYSTQNNTRYVDNGDVIVNTPYTYYSASSNRWTVACSGNWLNNSWQENVTDTGRVGGTDAFGVRFTQTSNFNTDVVGKSAYITTANQEQRRTTSNLADGGDESGFAFELQDYVYEDGLTQKYVGYKWYGSCTYDSNFANANGKMQGFYIHTYKLAEITSINLGSSTNDFIITTNITYETYSFKAKGNNVSF